MNISLSGRALAARLLACTWLLVTYAHADPINFDSLVFYPRSLPSEGPFTAHAGNGALSTGTVLYAALGKVPAGSPLETVTTISSYRQQIRQLEMKQGSYAPELFEPLLQQGKLLQEAGDYAGALESLQRASLISRVNKGLFSAEQISLTEAVIDCLQAQGQQDELESQLERLVSLNRKEYGPDQPQTALAMKGLAEWKLNSYVSGLQHGTDTRLTSSRDRGDLFTEYEIYSTSLKDLYQAQDTFLDAIRVLVKSGAYGDDHLYELENDLLSTYYLNANREWMLGNAGQLWKPGTRATDSMRGNAYKETLPDDFRKGVDSYRRQIGYLKQNPGATLGQLSDAMLGLADWYQLFEQTDKARQQHARIRSMLEKAGLDTAAIDTLTRDGEAVVLPVFMDTPLSPRGFDPAQTKGYIDVAITRNRFGRVERTRVLGESLDVPDGLQDHLLSLIRNSRFRIGAGDDITSAVRYYYDY